MTIYKIQNIIILGGDNMNNKYPFINEPLPYKYNSLEPYIDEKTMQLHHNRHLQTYINNLNKILKNNIYLQSFTLEEILSGCCMIPAEIRTPVMNNAGGVYNHRMFFDGMLPPKWSMVYSYMEGNKLNKTMENGKDYRLLLDDIEKTFGGFEAFKEKFTKKALDVFGSGYGWLVLNKGKLKIISTANQDTPLIMGMEPILTIDVWEHAYYLKNYNDRNAYIQNWFNVINWRKAEQRYMMGLDYEKRCK